MSKYVAIIGVGMLTLGYVITQQTCEHPEDSLDLFQVILNTERVQQEVAFHKEFTRVLESTLQELASGKLSLEEGSFRMTQTAETFSPIYCKEIRRSDPGASVQECVAQNLLGHLKDRAKTEPHLGKYLPELREEFHRMKNR
jgi:hypothetical protein